MRYVAAELTELGGHGIAVGCDHRADGQVRMIVLATHGRSGFKRWRLGSVADRVVRTAQQTTVLIRPQPGIQIAGSIKRILVPLDGSAASEMALPQAVALAKATGATLRLLRVVKPVAAVYTGQFVYAFNTLIEASEQAAAAYLQELQPQLEGVPHEPAVLGGQPSAAIIDAAGEADLIVMSSHGRGGLRRLALGSATDAVIRGAGKPVMIVRAATADENAAPAEPSVESGSTP